MNTQLENLVFPLLPSQHQDWLIGLSGGVDSIVLLTLCAEYILSNPAKISLYAVHLNHQTRGKDSDADEILCQHLCEQLGIKCYTKSRNIPQYAANNRQNFEEAAREIRHQLFHEASVHFKLTKPALLLAHHQDDNIETILMRLMRNSGMRGLCGISYSAPLPVYDCEQESQITIYRPLLQTPKKDIIAYAQENNLTWHEDRSNNDTSYTRNLLRNIVIPALKSIDPATTSNLQSLSNIAQQTEAVIQSELKKIKYRPYRFQTTIDESSARKAKLPAFIRLVEALCAKRIPNFMLPKTAYRSLRKLHSGEIKATDIACGLHITLYDSNFFIYPKDTEFNVINFDSYAENFHYEDSNIIISIDKTTLNGNIPEQNNPFIEYISTSFIDAPLHLTTVSLNTKLTPIGIKGSQRLSRILQNHRIPPHLRPGIPVLFYQDIPLWVAGVILCEPAKLTKTTGDVFCLRYSQKTL